MRIWSIHPSYLDARGLVALWRETLLAKHVLEGKTKGYLNHPQLQRFKLSARPLEAIQSYLSEVHVEAMRRNYAFDSSKFEKVKSAPKLKVNEAQLAYEFAHLLAKLKQRDPALYQKLKRVKEVETHPLFKVVKGPVEDWEIVKK